MTVKRKGAIVTSLEERPMVQAPKRRRALSEGVITTVDGIAAACERLRGGDEIQSAGLAVLRASASLANLAVQNSQDLDGIREGMRTVMLATNRLLRSI